MPSVTLLDSAGNYLFTTDLYLGNLEKVIELPDSSFLLYGWWGCDWISVDFRRFDKNWNQDQSFHAPDGYWNAAAALSNGDIIFSNGWQNKIKKVDKFGNAIWEKDGTFDGLNDYELLAGDSIIFAFDNGLLLMDSSGNFLDTLTNIGLKKIEINSQGNFLGSTQDSLYLLSSNFSVINNATFPQNENILDFDESGGKVTILTWLNHVYFYDADLMPINEFQINSSNYYYQILLEEDGVMLGGNTYYGGPQWPHSNIQPILKRFGLDGSTATISEDVGVIAVSQPSEIIFTPKFSNVYTMTYKNIVATVQNFGNSTVNKLNLNASFGEFQLSWEDCISVYQDYKAHFNNLSFAPGESIDLDFGDITVWHRANPNFSTSEEICLWTSSPDQKQEADRTNDVFCTEVLTTAKEPSQVLSNVSIWPNPAQQSVRLTLNDVHNANQWQLNDLQGRTVKSTSLSSSQQEAEITVSDLPSGMYLWKLLSQGGLIDSGKLVIAH